MCVTFPNFTNEFFLEFVHLFQDESGANLQTYRLQRLRSKKKKKKTNRTQWILPLVTQFTIQFLPNKCFGGFCQLTGAAQHY